MEDVRLARVPDAVARLEIESRLAADRWLIRTGGLL